MITKMVRGLTYDRYVELRDVVKDDWVIIHDQAVLVLAVERLHANVRIKYRVVGANKTRFNYTSSGDTEIMRLTPVEPRRGDGVIPV